MSIGKLEIQDGAPLPKYPKTLHIALAQLLIERGEDDFEVLSSGVYDVTPSIWTKHNHDHELTVLDDGEGIYRVLPRNKSAGFVTATHPGISGFRPGGTQNRINESNPFAVIAGGHPEKEEVQIYALIAYL